ncbi:MAG: hypothetical protein ABGX40_02420 [Methylococcales bacterium]
MSLACLQLVAQGLKLAPQPTLKTCLSTHPCLTIICWYLVSKRDALQDCCQQHDQHVFAANPESQKIFKRQKVHSHKK